jgi:hypothetical protein
MTTEQIEARRLKAFAEFWDERPWLDQDISRERAQMIYEHGWLDRGLAAETPAAAGERAEP